MEHEDEMRRRVSTGAYMVIIFRSLRESVCSNHHEGSGGKVVAGVGGDSSRI